MILNHGNPTPKKMAIYMMDMPKPIFHQVPNGTYPAPKNGGAEPMP